jgi:crotonobetainyl-CoA:carnitine CoA-transferase CaiB-like acyl-CoA transferase
MARNPDATKLGPPDGRWQPKGGVWECADGRYICTTDMETVYWKRFCEVVGRPQYFVLQHAVEQHPAMHADLKKLFATRARDEWVTIFAAADTQAMPVLSLAEALDNEHNRARGMYVDVPFDGGTVTHVGTPFHLSATPARLRHPATLPGAHNDEILADLGYGAEQIAALRAAGGFDG